MFTRRSAAPSPLTINQRAKVNAYLKRVINEAGGNVSGLNIRINQTTRRVITNNNIKAMNNFEARKLLNKINRGGRLINGRFIQKRTPLDAAASWGRRGVTAVVGGVGGAVAGVVAGLGGSQIERQLILDVPALIAGDWEKSRIIEYISKQLAIGTGIGDSEKIRKFLVKALLTGKVLNKNKTTQMNWGRNLGRQAVNLYGNYSRVNSGSGASKYANVKSGFIRGASRAYAPRTAGVVNTLRRQAPTLKQLEAWANSPNMY